MAEKFQEYLPRAQDACNDARVKLLYLAVSGSHAYGTNVPESDVDIRGVFLPGKVHVFGTRKVQEVSFGEDGKLHELRSYLAKLEAGTPNFLDWVFAPADCILYTDPLFVRVLAARNMFVTNALYKRITGYAIGQMRKMGSITRESGDKRKTLIDRHGYDTKNALHLLRLLETARLLFTTGEYRVRIPDKERDLLLRVRNGEMPLDDVKNLAESFLVVVDDAFSKSVLSDRPNVHDVDNLCIEVFEAAWA